jgi:hypothetical protein
MSLVRSGCPHKMPARLSSGGFVEFAMRCVQPPQPTSRCSRAASLDSHASTCREIWLAARTLCSAKSRLEPSPPGTNPVHRVAENQRQTLNFLQRHVDEVVPHAADGWVKVVKMDLVIRITQSVAAGASKGFNDDWVYGFGIVRCDSVFAAKVGKKWFHSG